MNPAASLSCALLCPLSLRSTDQLDGETDWKLRIPVGSTQSLADISSLLGMTATMNVSKPNKDVHVFQGNFQLSGVREGLGGELGPMESLSVDNTLWCVSLSHRLAQTQSITVRHLC